DLLHLTGAVEHDEGEDDGAVRAVVLLAAGLLVGPALRPGQARRLPDPCRGHRTDPLAAVRSAPRLRFLAVMDHEEGPAERCRRWAAREAERAIREEDDLPAARVERQPVGHPDMPTIDLAHFEPVDHACAVEAVVEHAPDPDEVLLLQLEVAGDEPLAV